MGGNALKKVVASRMTKAEFDEVSTAALDKLRAHPAVQKAEIIPAYASKESFGDIDIVFSTLSKEGLRTLFEDVAASCGATEVHVNSDVVSFNFPVERRGVTVHHQVDLIRVDPDEFEFALGYFSFNDLGNLMGRIAHKMGFKFGFQGLQYVMRDGDHCFATLTVTRTFKEAVEFLGFDWSRYKKGFDSLLDIFEFVAANPRFNPDIYLLDNLNAVARIRDKKRRTYQSFLAWCAKTPDLTKFEFPEDKTEWLPVAFNDFPKFEGNYKAAADLHENHKAAKLKFNGTLVSEFTGLTGKELGSLIQKIKVSIPPIYLSFDDWVKAQPPLKIRAKILSQFALWRRENIPSPDKVDVTQTK